MSQYYDRALSYAQRVVNGQETAGEFERLACRRFLADLQRQGVDGWPYVFDVTLGSRACVFLELLPHIKGEWAKPTYANGQWQHNTLTLEDWQVFQVIQIFGWVHSETRLRRFRRVYDEEARKNAKSTKAAGIGLYMLVADREPGSQVYSAATTGDQAREVFDVSRNMALRLPSFVDRFGVTVGKHDITVPNTASSFQALNAEGSTLDGLNVHCAIIDELHAHKKRDLFDVLDSATGARSQPLLLMITTAGTDLSGICYEQRDYTIKVLKGVVPDDTWFGVIYTLDDGDDWQDETVWRKSNPNLGVSVKLDEMRASAMKAKAQPSALNNFLTKRLNIWCNASASWMDMMAWGRCADSTVQDSVVSGCKCWLGLDLAEKKDFAALVAVFETPEYWFVRPHLYLNEQAVSESNTAHMTGWVRDGHVHVTPGALTDFGVIAKDIRAYCQTHDVQEVAFDPALSMYFVRQLLEEGLPMVEITQRSMFFTQPLLQVENLVLEGRLKHDGNPVMNWMVSNLVVKISKFNELRSPTKEREDNKIDGPMAMLMALGRALSQQSVTDLDDFLNNPIMVGI